MKSISSPASVKSVCAASMRNGIELGAFFAREIRCCDREQRATQAITHGIDPPIGNDRLDRIECRERAQTQVIIDPQVMISGTRIVPGNHEDGMAAINKVLDQRVLRREVQDVILHDPGRHDQDRFGHHLVRRRGILDELDEAVAIDNLAGSHRYIFAR